MITRKRTNKDVDALIDEVLAEDANLDQQPSVITAMAQKEGNSEGFWFYTLDDEPETHRPHVHVCVPTSANGYDGAENLKNGSPYKTIFAITLNPDKNYIYTADNIEIEFSHIGDGTKKDIANWILDICADWLNSTHNRLGIKNANKSLSDYIDSNGVRFYKKEYADWLSESELNNNQPSKRKRQKVSKRKNRRKATLRRAKENEVESGAMTALDRYIVDTSYEINQDCLKGRNCISLEEAIARMEKRTGKKYHGKI